MRRSLIAFGLLAACATEPAPVTPDPVMEPEGPPPVMGTVDLAEGASTQVFTTYDFSVGAFDGSAQVRGPDGQVILALMAYPDADPQAEAGVLRIEAALGTVPRGRTVTGEVSVRIVTFAQGDTTTLWSNIGRPTWLEVTTLERGSGPDAAYGHATGRYKTTLCDALRPEKNDCHEVSGRFDTQVQFDGV